VLPFAARSALVASVSFEIHTHAGKDIRTHRYSHLRVSECVCGHTLRCFLVDGIALVSSSLAVILHPQHLNVTRRLQISADKYVLSKTHTHTLLPWQLDLLNSIEK